MVVEGAGGRGIVWALVWDSALEASEFTDVLARATAQRTGAPERGVAGGGSTFAYKGRTVSILPHTIGDRAMVIFSDLPDGMGTDVVPTSGITLGK
jgi:hypothetical protein